MAKLGKIATKKVEADYCDTCGELVPKSTLKENGYCELECEECYQPKCMSCTEDVEEDGMFCSQSCIDTYKYDMRDKTLDY